MIDMRVRFLLAFAALMIAPFATLSAAPQALGLVASNAPVPLTCADGVCSAQFSTFCLQQARDIPGPGTPYHAVGDALSLLAVTADGKTQRLDGSAYLTFTSERGHSAVRLGVPERVLAELGAVGATVEVGPRVTLLPVPVPGDADPQTAQDIATVTGPLRELGGRIVDNAGAEADAVRLTGRLINGLPEIGRVGLDVGDPLWREQLSRSDVGPEAAALADQAYGTCRRRAEAGLYYNLRRCLEQQHDEQLLRLNRRYWRSILGS